MSAPRPPATEAPGPVRLLLRQRTHAAHTRLNHHPMLSGITQPGYPISRYKALIAAYQPLYAGLEQAIEDAIATCDLAFDYRVRRKLPWLNRDLDFLTHTVQATPAPIPPITGLGELVGVLYVIEGSTLGGGLIARQIAEHLGLTACAGGAFFHAYGAETQTRWSDFCRFMETLGTDPGALTCAAQRAEDTFVLFHQALDAATP